MSEVEVLDFKKIEELWGHMDNKCAAIRFSSDQIKTMSQDDWRYVKEEIRKFDNIKFACTEIGDGKRYYFYSPKKRVASQIINVLHNMKRGIRLNADEPYADVLDGGDFSGTDTTCRLF